MTIEEARKQYEIPAYVIEEYAELMLYKNQSCWECCEQDLEYMGLMTTLHQIGFEEAEITTYMKFVFKGKSTKVMRLKILDKKKCSLVEETHAREGQIDLLDYLRYKLQKESN